MDDPRKKDSELSTILEKSETDPLHLLKSYLDFDELVNLAINEANNIKNEIR